MDNSQATFQLLLNDVCKWRASAKLPETIKDIREGEGREWSEQTKKSTERSLEIKQSSQILKK